MKVSGAARIDIKEEMAQRLVIKPVLTVMMIIF